MSRMDFHMMYVFPGNMYAFFDIVYGFLIKEIYTERKMYLKSNEICIILYYVCVVSTDTLKYMYDKLHIYLIYVV